MHSQLTHTHTTHRNLSLLLVWFSMHFWSETIEIVERRSSAHIYTHWMICHLKMCAIMFDNLKPLWDCSFPMVARSCWTHSEMSCARTRLFRWISFYLSFCLLPLFLHAFCCICCYLCVCGLLTVDSCCFGVFISSSDLSLPRSLAASILASAWCIVWNENRNAKRRSYVRPHWIDRVMSKRSKSHFVFSRLVHWALGNLETYKSCNLSR